MSDEIQPRRREGAELMRPGYEALWLWFGLSRASWLTIPRVLLHQMPDEWQAKMASLLNEMDRSFPKYPQIDHIVLSKAHGKFIKTPSVLNNYRHPDYSAIAEMRCASESLTNPTHTPR